MIWISGLVCVCVCVWFWKFDLVWFGRGFESRDFILKVKVGEIWCFVFGFGLSND